MPCIEVASSWQKDGSPHHRLFVLKNQTALRAVIDSCGQQIAAIGAELRHSMTRRWFAASGWNHHQCDLAKLLGVGAPKIRVSIFLAVPELERNISSQESTGFHALNVTPLQAADAFSPAPIPLHRKE